MCVYSHCLLNNAYDVISMVVARSCSELLGVVRFTCSCSELFGLRVVARSCVQLYIDIWRCVCAPWCSEFLGVVWSCLELLGVAYSFWRCPVLFRAALSRGQIYSVLLWVAQICSELLSFTWSCSDLLGVTQNCSDLLGVSRSFSLLLGISWSYEDFSAFDCNYL